VVPVSPKKSRRRAAQTIDNRTGYRLQITPMSKRKTDAPLTDGLKAAIAESGLTLYRIALDTGVQKPSLIRFMRGSNSLRLDKADVLARYFGLEVVRRRKRGGRVRTQGKARG